MDEDDWFDPSLLVPILRPTPRRGPGPRVHRLIFPQDEPSPLILFHGRQLPDRTLFITPGHLVEFGLSAEELEDVALRNWQRHYDDVEWRQVDSGANQDGPAVLLLERLDDLVANLLISPDHLNALHEHFGTEIFHLGVPDDYTLLAHPDAAALEPLMDVLYTESRVRKVEFSPIICQVKDGRLSDWLIPHFYRKQMS